MTNQETQPTLEQLVAKVSVGEPLEWKGLQVFPLRQSNGHEPAYAFIDDLLEDGGAEITEVDEGGHVPTLKVLNRADLDGLILDGMELRGAKQNRMVNVTVIVGKHSETEIPVSCVEQGRWEYRSRKFASSKRTVAGKLRRLKAEMLAESAARSGQMRVSQGRVWDEVHSYLHEAAVASPTAAMDDVFAGREQATEECVAALVGVDAHGAVVVLNGEVIALDLFDAKATFKKAWPALLHGYSLDAVLESEPAAESRRRGREVTEKASTREAVEQWLRSLGEGAELERQEVPGVAEYRAVRSGKVAGGVVVHGGSVVHAALFPRGGRAGEAPWDEV